jgi:hypothetical protein
MILEYDNKTLINKFYQKFIFCKTHFNSIIGSESRWTRKNHEFECFSKCHKNLLDPSRDKPKTPKLYFIFICYSFGRISLVQRVKYTFWFFKVLLRTVLVYLVLLFRGGWFVKSFTNAEQASLELKKIKISCWRSLKFKMAEKFKMAAIP